MRQEIMAAEAGLDRKTPMMINNAAVGGGIG
jgi:hypothetical protein